MKSQLGSDWMYGWIKDDLKFLSLNDKIELCCHSQNGENRKKETFEREGLV
jgi:hypothetical protein